MSLIPLVDLAHLAALLGIRTWHPDDRADLDVLRELLARRQALAGRLVEDPPPAAGPPTYLRLLRWPTEASEVIAHQSGSVSSSRR